MRYKNAVFYSTIASSRVVIMTPKQRHKPSSKTEEPSKAKAKSVPADVDESCSKLDPLKLLDENQWLRLLRKYIFMLYTLEGLYMLFDGTMTQRMSTPASGIVLPSWPMEFIIPQVWLGAPLDPVLWKFMCLVLIIAGIMAVLGDPAEQSTRRYMCMCTGIWFFVLAFCHTAYQNHYWLLGLISLWFLTCVNPSLYARSGGVSPLFLRTCFRILLMIVHYFAFFGKLSSPDWLIGEPLRHWISNIIFDSDKRGISMLTGLNHYWWMGYAMAYGGIVFNGLSALLLALCERSWRGHVVLMSITILFSLATFALFNLGWFPLMLVMFTSCTYAEHVRVPCYKPDAPVDDESLIYTLKHTWRSLLFIVVVLVISGRVGGPCLSADGDCYDPNWAGETLRGTWHMKLNDRQAFNGHLIDIIDDDNLGQWDNAVRLYCDWNPDQREVLSARMFKGAPPPDMVFRCLLNDYTCDNTKEWYDVQWQRLVIEHAAMHRFLTLYNLRLHELLGSNNASCTVYIALGFNFRPVAPYYHYPFDVSIDVGERFVPDVPVKSPIWGIQRGLVSAQPPPMRDMDHLLHPLCWETGPPECTPWEMYTHHFSLVSSDDSVIPYYQHTRQDCRAALSHTTKQKQI